MQPNVVDGEHIQEFGMAFFDTASLRLKTSVFLLFISYTYMTALAVEDSIRLYGGSNSSEGFVEVRVAGVWKAICNDGWDAVDALVTCRQLGYTEGYAMLWQKNSRLSSWYATVAPIPNNPIEGNDFACKGDEDSLLSCKYTKDEFCSTPAGVACGIKAVKYNAILADRNSHEHYHHLVYTVTASPGRVLSAFRGSSGSYEQTLITGGICDMDEQAARLICSDQGYINGGKQTKVSNIEGLPMMVSKLTCGSTSYLPNCDFQYTSTGVCPDGIQYNGVICYTAVRPSVIGALVFAGVSSIVILIASACGVHWIRKDRKIPHVTLENEHDEDVIPDGHSVPDI